MNALMVSSIISGSTVQVDFNSNRFDLSSHYSNLLLTIFRCRLVNQSSGYRFASHH